MKQKKKMRETFTWPQSTRPSPSHQPPKSSPGWRSGMIPTGGPTCRKKTTSSSSSCMLDRASPERPPRRAAFHDRLVTVDPYDDALSSRVYWQENTQRFVPESCANTAAASRPSPARRRRKQPRRSL
jgi:hypothetical protein